MPIEGNFNAGIPTPVAPYVGPGDVVAGAVSWWGVRAYSRATAGTRAINIRASGDNATTDINTLANGNLDVATVSAFLATHGGSAFVTAVYDQAGSSNLTQPTAANQPPLTLSIIGSLPGISFVNASVHQLSNNSVTAVTQPYTATAVAKRTGNTANYNGIFTGGVSGLWFTGTTLGSIELESNTTVAVGGNTEGNFHAIVGIASTTNSFIYVDANSTGPGNAGTLSLPGSGTVMYMGSDGAGADILTGAVNEAGIWHSAFSAGQAASMISNQRGYWGF
jgi:hypothetical protein